MGLKILDVRHATDNEWDTIWKNCDYATYFHSREWAVIWQKYSKGRINPAAMLITFSDGALVLLPISYRKTLKGFIKHYVSSPAGTFGGWLSLDTLSENHEKLLCTYMIANHRNLLWRLNPYDPIIVSIFVDITEYDETQVLQLECGFSAIYEDWLKERDSIVRKARKAQRVGVKIREAVSLQDWKDYYDVYEDSLKRWGEQASSSYGWSLFQYMYDFSSSDIRLWLATYQDRVVSGALCFYSKKHVTYWHGAARSNYFNVRPVNLLMYEIIRHACEHGYQWFDFNPSGGHEGVKNFKSSFGAKKFACPIIDRKNCVFEIVSRLYTFVGHS